MRLAAFLLTMALSASTTYQSEIQQWREKRLASLKAEGGWLSLAGLFWLHEGANTFGKDSGNDIVLPDGPEKAGAFELHAGKVTSGGKEVHPDSADVVK